MSMKCEDCDRPLSMLEAQETGGRICFQCEIDHHIGRLIHHINAKRLTVQEVFDKMRNRGK